MALRVSLPKIPRLSFSNQMILGGLLYGKLTVLLLIILGLEPGERFVFNTFLSISAITIGIVAKFVEYRREKWRRIVLTKVSETGAGGNKEL